MKDKLIEIMSCHPYGNFSYQEWAEYFISKDVVPVVRCRDCKHLYCHSAVDRMFYCRNYPHGLKGTLNVVEENPYCSYGERKIE